MIDNILGIFAFSIKCTNGFKMKNKNPEIIIGKNNVEKKIPIGSNKKEIFEATKMTDTIIRI